jgi:hypothetical protein
MRREITKFSIFQLAVLVTWSSAGVYPGLAQQPQPTFSSAADAGQSLFQAAQHNDAQAITNIVGGPRELAASHDDAQDKLDRKLFVQKYQEMHRFGRKADGSVTLYIGAENWPFPIPIVEKNGAWRFDSDAGQKEILYRRIGEDELTAIAVCHDFVAKRHNRATPDIADADSDLAARLAAKAPGKSSDGDPTLFHGYYFREPPTRQTNGTRNETGKKTAGRFAMIAYPADYRSSGVMTFIVTDSDVVYEKDLGENTSAIASAMAAFRRDGTWHAANE